MAEFTDDDGVFEADELFGVTTGTPEHRTRKLSHPDPVVVSRRRAVLDKYPHPGTDMLNGDVLMLIDAAEPWEDALLARVARDTDTPSVPRVVLDYCVNRDFPGGGLYQMAKVAASVPSHWLPEKDDTNEVEAFLEVSASFHHFVDRRNGELVHDLLKASGGQWAPWLARLEAIIHPSTVDVDRNDYLDDESYQRALARKPTLADGAQGIWSVTTQFANQVVIPTLALRHELNPYRSYDDGYDIARSMILSGSSYEEVLGLTRFFGATSGQMESALYDRLRDADVPTWAPLTGDVLVSRDSVIVPLSDARDLCDEGRCGMNLDGTLGLNNGMATIVSQCIQGDCHVLSLRDVSKEVPERIATLVVKYDYALNREPLDVGTEAADIPTPWPGILIRMEMYGMRGAPVDERTVSDLKRFAVAVSEGTVALKVEPSPGMIESGRQLAASENRRRGLVLANDKNGPAGQSRYDASAGYPIEAHGAVEAAYESWRPFLPAYLASKDYEEIADLVATWLDEMKLKGLGPRLTL